MEHIYALIITVACTTITNYHYSNKYLLFERKESNKKMLGLTSLDESLI